MLKFLFLLCTISFKIYFRKEITNMIVSKDNCPVCKNDLIDGDDIVVCPECGVRYHRECYKQVGDCVFKDKHQTPDCPRVAHDKTNEVGMKQCPVCFTKSSADAEFCSRCGYHFATGNEESKDEENTEDEINILPASAVKLLMDPLGGVDPQEKFEGVSAGDIAEFVETNSPYYLNVFKRISKFNASKFNFAAFLFTGGWLLYRKQYKIGGIVASIMAALSILSTYITYFYYSPILRDVLSAASIRAADTSLGPEQSNALMQQIYSLPAGKIMILLLPSLLSVIRWTIMFLIGFRGNKIYMNHVISKVKEIKAKSKSSSEYKEMIALQGGVNVPIGICLFFCYIIINWLPRFFI